MRCLTLYLGRAGVGWETVTAFRRVADVAEFRDCAILFWTKVCLFVLSNSTAPDHTVKFLVLMNHDASLSLAKNPAKALDKTRPGRGGVELECHICRHGAEAEPPTNGLVPSAARAMRGVPLAEAMRYASKPDQAA